MSEPQFRLSILIFSLFLNLNGVVSRTPVALKFKRSTPYSAFSGPGFGSFGSPGFGSFGGPGFGSFGASTFGFPQDPLLYGGGGFFPGSFGGGFPPFGAAPILPVAPVTVPLALPPPPPPPPLPPPPPPPPIPIPVVLPPQESESSDPPIVIPVATAVALSIASLIHAVLAQNFNNQKIYPYPVPNPVPFPVPLKIPVPKAFPRPNPETALRPFEDENDDDDNNKHKGHPYEINGDWHLEQPPPDATLSGWSPEHELLEDHPTDLHLDAEFRKRIRYKL